MKLHGKILNGMVVLDDPANLPNGRLVTVVVDSQTPATSPAQSERMSEEEYPRIMAIMDRIAELPIEGSGEPFSGRDLDKVMNGEAL